MRYELKEQEKRTEGEDGAQSERGKSDDHGLVVIGTPFGLPGVRANAVNRMMSKRACAPSWR